MGRLCCDNITTMSQIYIFLALPILTATIRAPSVSFCLQKCAWVEVPALNCNWFPVLVVGLLSVRLLCKCYLEWSWNFLWRGWKNRSSKSNSEMQIFEPMKLRLYFISLWFQKGVKTTEKFCKGPKHLAQCLDSRLAIIRAQDSLDSGQPRQHSGTRGQPPWTDSKASSP